VSGNVAQRWRFNLHACQSESMKSREFITHGASDKLFEITQTALWKVTISFGEKRQDAIAFREGAEQDCMAATGRGRKPGPYRF
jgi:hypothetical protein